jgi:hypothetical protein
MKIHMVFYYNPGQSPNVPEGDLVGLSGKRTYDMLPTITWRDNIRTRSRSQVGSSLP